MAYESLSLKNVRRNFAEKEEEYFTTAAHFSLLINKVKNPSKKEIIESKKYLNHTYLGLYILLDNPLTDRQIDILYRASCGEQVSETAAYLNISPNRVLEIRKEIIRRFNARNAEQALYRASCAGYLPAYSKRPPALKKRNKEESQNAPA